MHGKPDKKKLRSGDAGKHELSDVRDIVKFSKYSQDFFSEYLADMANIDDLDEDAHLDFPE